MASPVSCDDHQPPTQSNFHPSIDAQLGNTIRAESIAKAGIFRTCDDPHHIINSKRPTEVAIMEPQALPKPSQQDGDSGVSHAPQTQGQLNALLLEAEYLQLVSSIRALFQSNQFLEEELRKDPNDADYLQAVRENVIAMQKKRFRLVQIVTDVRRQGTSSVLDIPQDIQAMNIDAWVKNSVGMATVEEDREEQVDATQQNEAKEADGASDAGVYL